MPISALCVIELTITLLVISNAINTIDKCCTKTGKNDVKTQKWFKFKFLCVFACPITATSQIFDKKQWLQQLLDLQQEGFLGLYGVVIMLLKANIQSWSKPLLLVYILNFNIALHIIFTFRILNCLWYPVLSLNEQSSLCRSNFRQVWKITLPITHNLHIQVRWLVSVMQLVKLLLGIQISRMTTGGHVVSLHGVCSQVVQVMWLDKLKLRSII